MRRRSPHFHTNTEALTWKYCPDVRGRQINLQWPKLMVQIPDSHCSHRDFPNRSSKIRLTQFSCHFRRWFRMTKPNLEATTYCINDSGSIFSNEMWAHHFCCFWKINLQIPHHSLKLLKFGHQKPLFHMHCMWNICPRIAILAGRFRDFLSLKTQLFLEVLTYPCILYQYIFTERWNLYTVDWMGK